MYNLISTFSFCIRVVFCYYTIDTVPIINNPLVQELFSELFSLYTLLWALSYFTNRIIIKEFEIKSASVRAILYFFIYLIYLIIIFVILKVLTWIKILPI